MQRGNGNTESLLTPVQRRDAGNRSDVFCERYCHETSQNPKSCDFFCTGEILEALNKNLGYLCCKKNPDSPYPPEEKTSCSSVSAKCTGASCLTLFGLIGTPLAITADLFRGVGRWICKGKKEEEPETSGENTPNLNSYHIEPL